MAPKDKTKATSKMDAEIPTGKKHRSPNYPVIGLRRALELAGKMYEAFKRSQVPIGVLHQKWSYKAHSGAGNQMVAALKAYGLIDVEGNGKSRKIRISEDGFKIIENHPERKDLLQVAALNPPVYRQLWEVCATDGPPAEELIKHHLKFELNFNTAYIDSVTADFLDTISLAELAPGDIIEQDAGGKLDQPLHSSAVARLVPGGVGSLTNQPEKANMGTDTFTLEEGAVILQYPTSLSKDSFEDLKTWVELQLRKIGRCVIRPGSDEPSTDQE